MVGGEVVGLARGAESTLVHVQSNRDTCSVRVREVKERTGEPVVIEVGDRIWWQAGHVYWTPRKNHVHIGPRKGGVDYDIRLPKIGYSH